MTQIQEERPETPPWWRGRTAEIDRTLLARVLTGLRRLPARVTAPVREPEPAAEPAAAGPFPDGSGIASLRGAFDALGDAEDQAVNHFYSCLFIARPQLRELFPPAMDEQRDRLFRALRKIIDTLSTPDELADYLVQLGRDHRKYSVEPGMYDAVGDALTRALRRYAGTAWTPAAEEAWTQAYQAASSIMIRAAETASGPATWRAGVVGHEYRGNGVAVLTVETEGLLPYQAGQHVTLQTPRWPRVWRPYSIACRPRDDGLLSFHVKAVSGGWVSRSLVNSTRPGDELILGPALGSMTLGHAAGRDLVLVAGGTGLSCIKALFEQAVRDAGAGGPQRSVHLYCGARTREELYDLRALWQLSDAYDGITVTPVTSDDPAFSGMQGNVGRVAARYLPRGECEAYVAGPAPMVRETITALSRANVPFDRIHYDDALLTGRARVGTGT